MDATRTHEDHGHAAGMAVGVASSLATMATIFVTGRASSSVELHGAMLLAAMGVAMLALWYGLRMMPALRAWSIGGIVATLAVAVLVGGLRSQPTQVDEQVVRADAATAPAAAAAPPASADTPAAAPRNELLARGTFEPLEHAGRGTASIIRTAGGRNVLTLTDFRTDAGPDLVVWLVAGNPADDSEVEQGRHVSLGKLKGSSGDQQYVLPADVDPAQFTHAYVWCRAFSVGFTRARLA